MPSFTRTIRKVSSPLVYRTNKATRPPNCWDSQEIHRRVSAFTFLLVRVRVFSVSVIHVGRDTQTCSTRPLGAWYPDYTNTLDFLQWSQGRNSQCACCLMGTDHGTGTKLRTGHAQYAPVVAREMHICIARLKLWSTSTILASFLKIFEVDNHGDLDVPWCSDVPCQTLARPHAAVKLQLQCPDKRQQESQWLVLWRLWNWSTPFESLWISSPPPNFMRFLQLKPCFSLFLFSTFVDAGATLLRS